MSKGKIGCIYIYIYLLEPGAGLCACIGVSPIGATSSSRPAQGGGAGLAHWIAILAQ